METEPKFRAAVKLPYLDGKTPLEPYLAQVEMATWDNQWGQSEAVVPLSLGLEGEVLQVLVDRPFSKRRDFEQLVAKSFSSL